MVDVLKLTYATLEQVRTVCNMSRMERLAYGTQQINTMSTTDNEGPAWNKFWLSLDNESESIMSGEGFSTGTPHRSLMSPEITTRNPLDRVDSSVLPNESASHNGETSPSHSALLGPPSEEAPFPFKFKAPSGRVHRLQVAASGGIADLVAHVTAKLGSEVEAVGGEASVVDGTLGKSGYALSYLDNEGDTVSITTDRDLLEAISLARHGHRDKVDLFVHDPTKPPLSATLDPKPVTSHQISPPPPAQSTIKDWSRQASAGNDDADDDDDDDAETAQLPTSARERKSRAQPKQDLIPGVSNDLLIPGVIAALAVVLIGAFALGRSSSR